MSGVEPASELISGPEFSDSCTETLEDELKGNSRITSVPPNPGYLEVLSGLQTLSLNYRRGTQAPVLEKQRVSTWRSE